MQISPLASATYIQRRSLRLAPADNPAATGSESPSFRPRHAKPPAVTSHSPPRRRHPVPHASQKHRLRWQLLGRAGDSYLFCTKPIISVASPRPSARCERNTSDTYLWRRRRRRLLPAPGPDPWHRQTQTDRRAGDGRAHRHTNAGRAGNGNATSKLRPGPRAPRSHWKEMNPKKIPNKATLK